MLKSLHDDLGHVGIERTNELLRRMFFWPKIAKDVEQHVKTCVECITPTESSSITSDPEQWTNGTSIN